MVVVETGESPSFERVRVEPGVYEATFVRDEPYTKEENERLKLFFTINVDENGQTVTKELMTTCPLPKILTDQTKLGTILKHLGLKEFTPNVNINTSAFFGKTCKVIVKDWERKDNGEIIVSSQITDFI